MTQNNHSYLKKLKITNPGLKAIPPEQIMMGNQSLISQLNEKLQLAELPLKRLSPISSYQTKKTASEDTPLHIEP